MQVSAVALAHISLLPHHTHPIPPFLAEHLFPLQFGLVFPGPPERATPRMTEKMARRAKIIAMCSSMERQCFSLSLCSPVWYFQV